MSYNLMLVKNKTKTAATSFDFFLFKWKSVS